MDPAIWEKPAGKPEVEVSICSTWKLPSGIPKNTPMLKGIEVKILRASKTQSEWFNSPCEHQSFPGGAK
jgi:hypothetical protein